MIYPLKFKPFLRTTLWGGDKIKEYKGINCDQRLVGESWEISSVSGLESIITNGRFLGMSICEVLRTHGVEILGKANYVRFGNEFPLLIKFIDAKQDLSIQVHPNDILAALRHNGARGKTEMWYVVDADKGSKLRTGFSRSVTPSEYVSRVEDNTLEEVLREYEVSVGDLFYLPAGRIHSIGEGCFIVEIQQTSNLTYRIYDFNRLDTSGNRRALHTDLAVDAIDYSVQDDYRVEYDREAQDQEVGLVDCEYFTTSLLDLTDDYILDYSHLDSFVILICVEGSANLVCDGYEISLRQGETVLIPATNKFVDIETQGCKLLTTY